MRNRLKGLGLRLKEPGKGRWIAPERHPLSPPHPGRGYNEAEGMEALPGFDFSACGGMVDTPA